MNEEEEDITWKSIIYAVPRGVLSFACRAATNSLATPDNLLRWGKKTTSRCHLCPQIGTLLHVLNNCSVALNQSRYDYRHNSVLQYIVQTIMDNKKSNIDVYADLPDFNIAGGTIPPNIAITSQKPDLVILNKNTSPPEVLLYELTCCYDTKECITNANSRKMDRYRDLKTDIEANGLACHIMPFEVCSRGFIPRRVKLLLSSLLFTTTTIKHPTEYLKNISKLSLLCSFTIFHARREKEWSSPPLLKP